MKHFKSDASLKEFSCRSASLARSGTCNKHLKGFVTHDVTYFNKSWDKKGIKIATIHFLPILSTTIKRQRSWNLSQNLWNRPVFSEAISSNNSICQKLMNSCKMRNWFSPSLKSHPNAKPLWRWKITSLKLIHPLRAWSVHHALWWLNFARFAH